MDRKSKIWQIVLLVLLLAAIAAIVLFNNRLKTSNTALSTAQEQLAEAQKNSADLQEQLDKTQASYDEVSAKLQADAEASDTQIKALQDKLTAAETQAKALETTVSESAAAIEQVEALQAEIAEHEATIETLTQQIAEKDAQSTGAAGATGATGAAGATDAKAEATGDTKPEDANGNAGADNITKADIAAVDIVNDAAAAATQALLSDTDALQARIDALLNSEGEFSDEDRQAELQTLKTELTGYIDQLEAAASQYSETEAKLEAVDATLDDMQNKLAAAEKNYNTLSADLDEKRATIDSLNAQIEALSAQSETDAAQLEALNAQLAKATEEAEDKAKALAESQAAYEKQLAEVEAYKLSRELSDGDALTATSVHNSIDVAADGVTAEWHYDNTAISAKDVVLKLQLDGETLYTSDTLKPGESIDQITLDKALASGQYEAVAVTSVYGDDGEVQFTNRVPVTLNVR